MERNYRLASTPFPPQMIYSRISSVNTCTTASYNDLLNLHSQTLPWGAVCRRWTLKSRPARSCRSCVLSIPRTRSGSRNRWSIPSCGPCCRCWCLLVAVGVALDAVSILTKAHLTRTDENHIHWQLPTPYQHNQSLESDWLDALYRRAELITRPAARQYPSQADTDANFTDIKGGRRGRRTVKKNTFIGVNERQSHYVCHIAWQCVTWNILLGINMHTVVQWFLPYFYTRRCVELLTGDNSNAVSHAYFRDV
jgi:hypothetical protein